jgi:isopenicillin N synthase-like dioxygenase
MTGFYWECFKSARELLRAVAVGIGLEDEDYLLRFHSGHNNQLRLLHYPPVETEKLSSNALARMPAHSDWGSVTMLFQDDCGGLQVEDPNRPGTFVDATPMKRALVMNVGDLLMRWSNGKLSGRRLCENGS